MSATIGAMDYELMKADLRRRYPDWQIWYVPMTTGQPSWHARPKVSFQAGSPDELAQMIETAELDSKGFDPEGDMPVRLRDS